MPLSLWDPPHLLLQSWAVFMNPCLNWLAMQLEFLDLLDLLPLQLYPLALYFICILLPIHSQPSCQGIYSWNHPLQVLLIGCIIPKGGNWFCVCVCEFVSSLSHIPHKSPWIREIGPTIVDRSTSSGISSPRLPRISLHPHQFGPKNFLKKYPKK